jgi:hypothetical protein
MLSLANYDLYHHSGRLNQAWVYECSALQGHPQFSFNAVHTSHWLLAYLAAKMKEILALKIEYR